MHIPALFMCDIYARSLVLVLFVFVAFVVVVFVVFVVFIVVVVTLILIFGFRLFLCFVQDFLNDKLTCPQGLVQLQYHD